MTWLIAYITVAWTIRVLMVPVVLRRQFAPGASVAWLGIVFLHPYVGIILYLFLGETRLGIDRVEQHRQIVSHYRSAEQPSKSHNASKLMDGNSSYGPLVLQTQKLSGLPLVGGALDLIPTSDDLVGRLSEDIAAASQHVHLLYYMFTRDATGQRIADATMDAARRGVQCRVLVDAVASRAFFHHNGLGSQLKSAGVEIAAAMPVGSIRRGLPRMDLRNHRKLAVVDGKIGYMGSHNLVNPDYGGRHGGPWIDLTARFTGSIVRQLGLIFAEDWAFETGKMLSVPNEFPVENEVPMQLAPTGPTPHRSDYRRLLLSAIQTARRKIVVTTPYFVPDDPTLIALLMAADRGVDVQLIVPKVSDHLLTAGAGRAHFAKLLKGGVSIHLFKPGLLHAKTITVDEDVSFMGSANLDVRSFHLNFELTTVIYGCEETSKILSAQMQYKRDSDPVLLSQWESRNVVASYFDDAVGLLSPLL